MVTVNEQINDAIALVADRGIVFSATDVAGFAGLEGLEDFIESTLHSLCVNKILLPLDKRQKRFVKLSAVEKWWVDRTLRWSAAQLDYLFPDQIARSMSLSFLLPDDEQWQSPPTSLLEVGKQWAMVADGCFPGTFVSPWASVLIANPHLIGQFQATFVSKTSDSWTKELFDDAHIEVNWQRLSVDMASLQLNTPVDTAVDKVLNRLTEREADIFRHRLGIVTGHRVTLEQLGLSYKVTRERIRQIEKRVWRKLTRQKHYQDFWIGFAAAFVSSNGKLVFDESSMTPQQKLVAEIIRINTIAIPELSLYITGSSIDTTEYRGTLVDADSYPDTSTERPHPLPKAFWFLSKRDGERLIELEHNYRTEQITKSRARMLRQALRSLGRAAHYNEIAEEANRLFPERKTSTHNWHAPLSLPAAESLGIVWIGTMGMYGLKEHGYSRPKIDMFDAVVSIVEEKYDETGRPVSYDFVFTELSKQRRELNPNSVMMALTFNERLTDIGGNRFVPKSQATHKSGNAAKDQFDIDVAFAAFSDDEDAGTGHPPCPT